MSEKVTKNILNMGWKCPECKMIYNPSVMFCAKCSSSYSIMGMKKSINPLHEKETIFVRNTYIEE